MANEPRATSANVPRTSARYCCIFPMAWAPCSGSERRAVLRIGRLSRRVRVPVEIREPELDERPYRVLEARLACDLQRLLVALANLVVGDALLEAVVTRHQQTLDPRPRVVAGTHRASVTKEPSPLPWAPRWSPSSPSSRCCS